MGLVLLLAFLGLVISVGYPYPFYAHNYNLNRFSKQIRDLKLPDNTQKMGRLYKSFGNHFGNSNKGDYVVGQLIASTFSKDEIIDYYKNMTFHHAELDSDWWHAPSYINKPNPVSFHIINVADIDFKNSDEIYFFSDYFWQDMPATLSAKMFKVSKEDYMNVQDENKTLYLITIVDPQYWPDEIRCH